MSEVESKKCSKCGAVKLLEEFGKNKSRKDGYQAYCRSCFNEYFKSPERKQHRNQYRSIPEIKEYRKEYENSPNIKEHRKKYEKTSKCIERRRQYKRTDMGKIVSSKAYHKRRAVKLTQLHPNHNPRIEAAFHKMRIMLDEETGIKWAVDHIWPLAKGGPHHHCNLQVIPLSINCEKKDSMDYTHPDILTWRDIPSFLTQDLSK